MSKNVQRPLTSRSLERPSSELKAKKGAKTLEVALNSEAVLHKLPMKTSVIAWTGKDGNKLTGTEKGAAQERTTCSIKNNRRAAAKPADKGMKLEKQVNEAELKRVKERSKILLDCKTRREVLGT